LQQPLCFACPEALKPVNWLVRPLFFPNSVILLNISMKIDGFVKSPTSQGYFEDERPTSNNDVAPRLKLF